MQNSMKNDSKLGFLGRKEEGIKIENFVFFPKNKTFLINRGGRMRIVKIEENGRILVQLKDFNTYFLDIKTFEIFTLKKGKKELVLPLKNRAKKTWLLSRNGIREEVGFWKIIKDNMKEIEAKFI